MLGTPLRDFAKAVGCSRGSPCGHTIVDNIRLIRGHSFTPRGQCLPVGRSTLSGGGRLGRGSNCWWRLVCLSYFGESVLSRFRCVPFLYARGRWRDVGRCQVFSFVLLFVYTTFKRDYDVSSSNQRILSVGAS